MIKKSTNLRSLWLGLSALFIFEGTAFAKQVPANDAKTVAENFFSRQTNATASAELSYTSLDSQGKPLYYAFNINSNSGFVIISAEDIAKPIIGYSTETGFQKPNAMSSVSFWLSQRETEISTLRTSNATANAAITAEWNGYLTASHVANRTTANTAVVGPLVVTKWNQSPYYNDMCPGGSVTGCVATTMAQIMKYWAYPAKGTGQSSYCDCTSSGYPNNYGTLSANYGNTTYNWGNMPNSISTHNTDIAQLMFHCGVSVNMNYDPSGSSANVISINSPISAENAYITYFGYDPSTILGVNRGTYSDADWMSMIKGDLDIGRPIQYAGFGPQGGHTWVCDGYDNNDYLHMNWGWGGMADGYFNVDNLNPANDNFSNMQQGLFGIVPLPANGEDAAVISIAQVDNACSASPYTPTVKIRNLGNDQLTSCNIHYAIDNGAAQVMQWTGYLVQGQSEDVALPVAAISGGAHNISCSVSDPNSGTDVNANNDQSSYAFSMFSTGTLPVVEGFENPSQTQNDWTALSTTGSNWSFTSQSFSGGAQSMMINNNTNTAGNTSILMGLKNYDFSHVGIPTLYFKVAYQQKTASSNDKLSLQYSSDCGTTWFTKWTRQGAALASVSAPSTAPFIPTSSQYTAWEVPGVISHNVIFRWVFVADATAPGNNIYLDDINLGEKLSVGIQTIDASAGTGFEIFPNPSNGEATVKFNLAQSSNVQVSVSDLSGRKIVDAVNGQLNAGEQTLSLNKDNSLSSGIYLVTISADGVKSSRKLIIN